MKGLLGMALRTGRAAALTRGYCLAFTFIVTNQPPFPVIRRGADLFRLLCVLVVALVTTYHTCRPATAQASQPAVICVPIHQNAPDHMSFSGEVCHTCTMVSLPAFSVMLSATDESTACDAASVQDLTPFHPRLTSPPPKA